VLAHFAAASPKSLPPAISSRASAVLAAAYTAATLVSVSLFFLILYCAGSMKNDLIHQEKMK